MTLSVTKCIEIRGGLESDYMISSEGGYYISVYMTESNARFDIDNPVMYLKKEEAQAMAKAFLELIEDF